MLISITIFLSPSVQHPNGKSCHCWCRPCRNATVCRNTFPNERGDTVPESSVSFFSLRRLPFSQSLKNRYFSSKLTNVVPIDNIHEARTCQPFDPHDGISDTVRLSSDSWWVHALGRSLRLQLLSFITNEGYGYPPTYHLFGLHDIPS